MTRDEILRCIAEFEDAYKEKERQYRFFSEEAKRVGGESERIAKAQRDAASAEMGEIRAKIAQLRDRL